MPVLKYCRKDRTWSFSCDRQLFGFAGARTELAGGRRIVFEDVSPKNYNNIKLFKSVFREEAKADRAAVERIRALSEEQKTDWVEKYRGLLSGTPYAHQVRSIQAMQTCDRLALLLEQGLGKTYISIMSMRMFKARDGYLRALVMCPAIVFESWLAEFDKFAPELKVLKYKGDLPTRLSVQDRIRNGEEFDVLLTTYDMLRSPDNKKKNTYKGIAWERLPCDVRERIAAALFSGDGKARKLLLDEGKSGNRTWYSKCGKLFEEVDAGKNRALLTVFPDVARELKLFMAEFDRCLKADRAEEFFNGLDLSVTVFDEASRLINHNSHTAQSMEQLKTRRMYMLSGTLCVGRPTDMYMPMRILDRSIFGMNWWQFRNRYCNVSSYNSNIITGYKNVDDLKHKIQPFTISYLREECLDLPERTIVTCYYSVDDTIRRMYNAILEADDRIIVNKKPVYCYLDVQKIQKCMQVLSGFIHVTPGTELCGECGEQQILACEEAGIKPANNRCRRHLEFKGGEYDTDIELPENPKLQMLENDLTEITPTEKVIVWAWYQFDLTKIEELLKKLKISYITANEPRCAQRFEEDDGIRVFLGQVAQGIGITLNSATTTIYYSHGTALEPRLQSMDRNMRIGQKKPVVVRDYVCRGSVEAAIVELLQHKDNVHEFIQKAVECLGCSRLPGCQEHGVRKYGRGCLYHDDMVAACTKRKLSLDPI